MLITLARKPLSGSVVQNVLAHGCGALNIDASRIASNGEHMVKGVVTRRRTVSGDTRTGKALGMYGAGSSYQPTNHEGGRWPANVLHDGSLAVLAGFPEVKGEIGRAGRASAGDYTASSYKVGVVTDTGLRDTGSAARFFKQVEADPC